MTGYESGMFKPGDKARDGSVFQTCQKPLCPTCLEAERRLYGAPS